VSSHPGDVTQLLLAWSQGSRQALEDLVPVVYAELHHMAVRYFRHERPVTHCRQRDSCTRRTSN
jgi:ECF sigma factor